MGVTQIELTEQEERDLRRLAEKEQASVAALARELVLEGLRRRATLDREELKRRFLAGLGTGHSGLHDVARRHDDYLEEIHRS